MTFTIKWVKKRLWSASVSVSVSLYSLDGGEKPFMTIHLQFGRSLKVFRHHPTIHCKYLHRIWMVRKGYPWPFCMLTDADHKRFRIHGLQAVGRCCTRGESEDCTGDKAPKPGIHPGFEIKDKLRQSSRTGCHGPTRKNFCPPNFFKIWSINKNKCCDVSHIGYCYSTILDTMLLYYVVMLHMLCTMLWWCCTCCVQCCGDVAHVVVMLHMLCTMQLYCCHVRTDAQTVYCSCLINHM